ncbi:MAG: type II secretion system F family protein [Candidatus Saelkia tenebricola]|nr:type II secretion system F family protein [Candidatus Saelkia tenebricola]
MPLYSYLVRDKKGQAIKGRITVSGESELLHFFEEQGFLAISFEQVKSGSGKVRKKDLFIFQKKVKKRDLIVFTLQFATTIKAGIPVVNALRFLVEETQDQYFKAVLTQVIAKVEQGGALSGALRDFPDIFPDIYTEMIASGEVSGNLDSILTNLAETMRKDYAILLEVKNALRYPVIVVTGIIFAILFISILVVPRFARVYNQLNMSLPLTTRMMIGTSDFLLHNIPVLIIVIIASLGGFSYWKNSTKGNLIWGRFKLKIPLVGDIFIKVSLLRFCFIFNILNGVGIPILKSLEIVSKTLGNSFLQKRVEVFNQGVSEGRALSSMIKEDGWFPQLVGNMIGVGEQTGAMDVVLSSLSEYYRTELKNKVDALTVTIEPLLTALLAVGVLILALGVFLPMWNMTQLFKA